MLRSCNIKLYSLYLFGLVFLLIIYSVLNGYESSLAPTSFWNHGGRIYNNIYIERIDHLNKACSQMQESSNYSLWEEKDVLNHLLVDTKHHLLYCYVPKVACTNWKRVFLLLSGNFNTTDALKIPAYLAHNKNSLLSLSNFSRSEADNFLKYYTKFLFVRHPFERLLSAFKNKLESNFIKSDYFQKRFGKYIIENYRMKPSNISSFNNSVTFEEFTSYLAKSPTTMYNEHWMPINSLCQPCKIKYDFIGKYETLYLDSNYVLKYIGINNIKFPPSTKASNTYSLLKRYFSSLPLSRIKQLFSIYKNTTLRKLFQFSESAPVLKPSLVLLVTRLLELLQLNAQSN